MLKGLIPLINATKFGFGSVKELWDFELQSKDIYTRTDIIEEAHSRWKRQDVMYVNVGGAPADNACPSVADSSAVSLAQMAFFQQYQ